MTTIRSRELADALRLAMENANLSGKYAAHVLGWSESKVSRMLTGRQPVTETDVASLLALCMVTGDEKERLLKLAREHDQPGWLQSYRLSDQLRTLINHEHRATDITEFELGIVPGLLQTEGYARALLERCATLSADRIEARIATRLNRQNLFNRLDPPTCVFFLHELALRLPVGGPAVMSNQLHHLLRMSVRSCITIRVVPMAFGAHAGVIGSCRLMESVEFEPVVYIEEETAGHYLEEPDEIAAYGKVFTALANCALDEGQSRDLIAGLAVGLYADREDQHDRVAKEQL